MAEAADRFRPVFEDQNACFLCLTSCDKLCNKCALPYCSDDHFKVHFNEQSQYCYPFRVLQRPEVGRYLVSTRNIDPLEMILEEGPAVFGPNHDTVPACMECLLPVNGSFLCPNCFLPLCGPDCQDGPNHMPECQVFSKPLPTGFKFRVNVNRPIPEGQTKAIAPEYCCITPLRCLELQKNDPSLWNRLQLLMDHDEERKSEIEYQEMFQVNVVAFLTKVCGLDYSEEEIFRIIGIIRTNALHVEDPVMKMHHVSGRVVYPTLSYLSHSCVSNARYSMTPKDHRIRVRAQVGIRKGEEITIQYLSFMFGHLKRKSTIRSFWFFDCSCPRCRDPTELGSMMSAMKCSDCVQGNLLPMHPMVSKSDWQCSSCDHQQSAQSVEDYINYCDDILYDTLEHDVEKYEKLIQEFTQRLHPNHYIVMTVKKFLADLYGSTQGYQYNQLSEERLNKKIQYYQEFLDTIGKVDPGYTKWRGQVLYEMHRPMLIKANKDLDKKLINKSEFLSTLRKISLQLEESVKCLEPEAEGTKEKHQASLASKALTSIKELIFFSDYI